MEEQIVKYVGRHLKKPEKIERFGFDQCLRLAEALNDIAAFDWIFEACRKLNQIRNKISHQLSPKDLEEAISDFVDYVATHGEAVFPKDLLSCNRPEFRIAIFAVYGSLKNLNRKPFSSLLIPTLLAGAPNQPVETTAPAVTPPEKQEARQP